MANKVDATIPQNSESPTLGAQRIRETRAGYNALLTVEHDISDDATTSGFHGENVTGKAAASITTPPTGYGRFGWKVISGVSELFYRDDAGNEVQITSAGKILSASLDMLDEDNMASDSATHAATQQSIKAYVDNSVPIGDSPTLNDSESNAMLKSHAYLTQTAGFVTAFKKDTSETVGGFVGDTTDPAGAGLEIATSQANATSSNACISFFVAKGKYFEIIKLTDNPVITWTPLVAGGGNPIDNG